MPDLKISQLPAASTPLAGTELVPVVQGGITEQTPVQSLLTSTVPSGTANAVMYLNGSKVATTGGALTFDGSNLGIGTSSPGSFDSAWQRLVVGTGSGDAGQTIYSGSSSIGTIAFADGTTGAQQYVGLIRYLHSSDAMTFWTGATERMRLDASGNLGIGTSSPVSALGFGESASATGVTFQSTNTTFNSGKVAVIKAAVTGSGNGSMVFETYAGGSGGGERMRLDSSGNLGIGTTPSGWSPGTFRTAIQIGYAGFAGAPGTEVTEVSSNQYVNSSGNRIYIATGVATLYQQNGGQHAFYTAPSGTAGNAASFTQAMTLDASGNLLVGGTGETYRINSIKNTGTSGLETNFIATNQTDSNFAISVSGSAASDKRARIGTVSNTALAFATADTERARIDSAGNFIHQVNGTAPSLSTNSTMSFELTSNTSLKIVVRGTDGVTRSASLTLA